MNEWMKIKKGGCERKVSQSRVLHWRSRYSFLWQEKAERMEKEKKKEGGIKIN